MTKQELLNLDHLKIAEEKPNYFVHVHTEDGWYLTDWDKKDIKDFHASVCWYFPIKDEYNDFYAINSFNYEKYMEEQKIAIEKELNEKNNQ